ncbi:histidine phosphatase family protein [Roseivivax sp. THAF30]|uniref:histidine phosphatase family protein n=1 Tax=Roseivivax sp. THAF30 TaxID=2587852 RepID=UPI001268D37C|nr:histidine phosphatase family protein [Roseivivax sp. THAF30]QFT62961.1 bifunctional RNase H/acid phosphatase [Roseivivax sp. THAF30]
MPPIGPSELILIRHAPADHGGRLVGRTDVPAILPEKDALSKLRAALSGCEAVSSPARRCRETAAAVFPGREIPEDACLWEQDFGAEDGLPFDALPDLGPLTLSELAQRRPPEGESFSDLCERAAPALERLEARAREGGSIAVIAHAGLVRAALSRALGHKEAGLAFEIAPLSLTRLRCHPGGLSIICVNAPGL